MRFHVALAKLEERPHGGGAMKGCAHSCPRLGHSALVVGAGNLPAAAF